MNTNKSKRKFKISFISVLMAITLLLGSTVGAVTFVGSGSSNTGDYNTTGGTHNIPSPTDSHIPVGYRFSLVYNDGTLHYATKNYTATVIDTTRLNECGSEYSLNSVNYILVNKNGSNNGVHNALSKIDIKNSIDKLHFKTAKLDTADKRTDKNVFLDNGKILNNLGVCNSNGYFVLPNATSKTELDAVIKTWAKTSKYVTRTIKLLGSKYCSNNSNLSNVNSLSVGDGLFVEPIWAFNYGGTKVIGTPTEIALLWANTNSHGMSKTFLSYTSNNTTTPGNLAKTFGYRFPKWLYIKSGTLENYRSLFKNTNGKKFTLTGCDVPTWKSGASNNLTPKQLINGGYGISLAFNKINPADPTNLDRIIIKYANISTDTIGTDFVPDNFTPKTQLFSQTKDDLNPSVSISTFDATLKPYTKIIKEKEWVCYDTGTARFLEEGYISKFNDLRKRLGLDGNQYFTETTKVENTTYHTATVTLYPNIVKAKVNINYRVIDNSDSESILKSIVYSKSNSTYTVEAKINESSKYDGYVYKNGELYSSSTYAGELVNIEDTDNFNNCFGINYKHINTNNQNYYIVTNGTRHYLNKNSNYEVAGPNENTTNDFFSACGYSEDSEIYESFKKGNDQTITLAICYSDNIGEIGVKVTSASNQRPALNTGFKYNDNGVVCYENGNEVTVYEGKATKSCDLSGDILSLSAVVNSESKNIFKSNNSGLRMVSPFINSGDESAFTIENILSQTAEKSLKTVASARGYIEIDNFVNENPSLTINYHIGGIYSDTVDGIDRYIKPDEVIYNDESPNFLVNDSGYICFSDGSLVSDTFYSDDSIVILGLNDRKFLTNFSYMRSTDSWRTKDDRNVRSTNTYTFSDFINRYASKTIKATEDGNYELTLYLSWAEFTGSTDIYAAELYEISSDGSYVPINNTLHKNGCVIEENKNYAIKTVIKTSVSSLFSKINQDTITYNLTVSIGKYTNEGKTVEYTFSTKKALTVDERGKICHFLVPETSNSSLNEVYADSAFNDGATSIEFLNSAFDTSNIIITSDLLSSISDEMINSPNDYDDTSEVGNNNRFYIDVNVQFADPNIKIIEDSNINNSATFFMFTKVNKPAINSCYSVNSDINTISPTSTYTPEIHAYSGQALNRYTVLNKNSDYNSYYNIDDSTKTEASSSSTSIEDKYHLLRNTDKTSIINSPFTSVNWKSSGAYNYSYAHSTNPSLNTVKGVDEDNRDYSCDLYYTNAHNFYQSDNPVNLSVSGDVNKAKIYVHPVDLIAPNTQINNSVFDKNASGIEEVKPYVMFYGYDITENKWTLIAKDANAFARINDIETKYSKFKIFVRYCLVTDTDYYFKGSDGTSFDTDILTDIYFNISAEKTGEIFGFKSDKFEFSTDNNGNTTVDGVNGKSKSMECKKIDDSYIYSLEFTSPEFEINPYTDNNISVNASISLSEVNLYEDEGKYFSTPIYDNGVFVDADSLSEGDVINQFLNESIDYNLFKKSFETNSYNNESSTLIKFRSGSFTMDSMGNNRYRKGTNVITSFGLNNFTNIDFTGLTSDKLIAKSVIKDKYGENVNINQDVKLVVPRGISRTSATSTLCYFEWNIDKTYKVGDYEFDIFYYDSELNEGILIGTLPFKIENKITYNTPDTTYTKTRPSGYIETSKFSYSSVSSILGNTYANENNNTINAGDSVEWEDYIYNNEALRFEKVNHKYTLYSQKRNIYNSWDATMNKIASGYGFTAFFNVTSKYETVNTDIVTNEVLSENISRNESVQSVYTSPQNVTAFFPEFNYKLMSDEEFAVYTADGVSEDVWKERSGWNQYTEKDKINRAKYGSCCTMILNEDNCYTLPYNTSTLNKVHYIPIWYPDGDYKVKFVVSDIWTPIGMLSMINESNSIEVSGTLYDDWYYASYTYIPDDDEIDYIRRVNKIQESQNQDIIFGKND